MKYLVIALAALPLAACDGVTPRQNQTVEPPISPISAATGDVCGAHAHEALTGQDATALERVLILGQVRVLRPGQAYTEDVRPERLNFDINRAGRIARVYCG